MTDYASLKVPDLKKLLQERSLPQSGNKADLIARLQENDKNQTEDVIDWDDDDTKPAAAASKKEDPKPEPAAAAAPAKEAEAVAAPAVAAEPAKPAAPAAEEAPKSDATPEEAPESESDAPAAVEEKPAEGPSFALGLNATDADEETKKRAERAKRFGITVDAESDDAKKAERAQRFGGVDDNKVVKGLDEALPERRPKRGREHGDDGQGGGKRQSLDRRNGGRDNRSRGGRRHGGRGGGGNGGGNSGRPQRQGGGGAAPARKNVIDDPAEKAKAEARAKRFAGGN